MKRITSHIAGTNKTLVMLSERELNAICQDIWLGGFQPTLDNMRLIQSIW